MTSMQQVFTLLTGIGALSTARGLGRFPNWVRYQKAVGLRDMPA